MLVQSCLIHKEMMWSFRFFSPRFSITCASSPLADQEKHPSMPPVTTGLFCLNPETHRTGIHRMCLETWEAQYFPRIIHSPFECCTYHQLKMNVWTSLDNPAECKAPKCLSSIFNIHISHPVKWFGYVHVQKHKNIYLDVTWWKHSADFPWRHSGARKCSHLSCHPSGC